MTYKKLKYWFDKDLAILLADKIQQIQPEFNRTEFIDQIDAKVNDLELKDRVEVMADALYEKLGTDYQGGLAVLLQILGPENEEETGMFTNFYWIMPIAKYVEKYGLEHFESSIQAIEEITKRNTGEYTIRPFLETETTRTLAIMENWSKNPNKHVRRLASEGVRPRLPWAKKLNIFILDPKPIFPILENLKDDSSKYVQKSVANCLNDILKDNFDSGQALLESWVETDSISKERAWIIKHALRSLVKKKDAWAQGLLEKTLSK